MYSVKARRVPPRKNTAIVPAASNRPSTRTKGNAAPTEIARVRRLRLETAGATNDAAPAASAAITARVSGTSESDTTRALATVDATTTAATRMRQTIRLGKARPLPRVGRSG